MKLFHYTTEQGYKGMVQTQKFNPSTDTTTDASFGKGWYFTDIPPGTCERDIYMECFGGIRKKIEYYIEVEIPDRLVTFCRKHVYLVSVEKAPKEFLIISHGKIPECPHKPCEACAKYRISSTFTHNIGKNILPIVLGVVFGMLITGGLVKIAELLLNNKTRR